MSKLNFRFSDATTFEYIELIRIKLSRVDLDRINSKSYIRVFMLGMKIEKRKMQQQKRQNWKYKLKKLPWKHVKMREKYTP